MVSVSQALYVVFKTTGGRLWNKPWGLPALSRTQKENRRKINKQIQKNMSVLKSAAAAQPEVPVRLSDKRILNRHQKAEITIRFFQKSKSHAPASHLPPAAQEALKSP